MIEIQIVIAILSLAGIVITGQFAIIITIWRRRNNRNNNSSNRYLHSNPHDPDNDALGDVTVGWWQKEMQKYTDQVVNAIKDLKPD